MNILYVMESIRHPALRGELRHYHFLKRLSRKHDITLVGLGTSPVPEHAIDDLSQWTARIVLVDAAPPPRPARRGLLGAVSRIGWRLRKQRRFRRGMGTLRRHVHRLLREGDYDLLLFSGADLHPVFEPMTGAPMIVDWCDIDSIRLRRGLRHVGALEWPWRLLRYQQARRLESRVLAKLRYVTFVSQRDRVAARAARDAVVIPNGCDLNYWVRRGRPRESRVVFTGVLDYPPNADAARYLLESIVPMVRRCVPALEVVIAGRNPSRELVALARRSPGALVTGSVPDLRPYLDSASAFIAPLRFASGMQNKILEAMAMELPVVTTPVAAEGLRIGDEEPPLLVAESPGDLAGHVVRLLHDEPMARRLGAQGRDYVRRNCSWERSAMMLDRLCEEASQPRALSPARELNRTRSTGSSLRVTHRLV